MPLYNPTTGSGGVTLVPPVLANFTADTTPTTPSIDDASALIMTGDNDNAYDLLTQNPPAAPYSITAKISSLTLSTSSTGSIFAQPSIVLRNSTGGAFTAIQLGTQRGSQNLFYVRGADFSTISSNPSNTFERFMLEAPKWVKIDVTSTTVTVYSGWESAAGALIWTLVAPAFNISTFIGTIDKIGLGMRSSTSNNTTLGFFEHYVAE